MNTQTIPGYTYGTGEVAPSPVTGTDVALLKDTLLWSDDDDRYLRMAGDVLGNQIDGVLDLWYGYVGAHPHLIHYFAHPNGEPNPEYLARVRARFAQWVRDVCERHYDDAWRDYQHEIGLRHTSARKNVVDGVDSTPDIALRYVIAFIFPITATMRSFLAAEGHSAQDVDGMQTAWFKAVVLHVCLWTEPYAPDVW